VKFLEKCLENTFQIKFLATGRITLEFLCYGILQLRRKVDTACLKCNCLEVIGMNGIC